MRKLFSSLFREPTPKAAHILFASKQDLIDSRNALPEAPRYRPDLYPEQLDFQLPGGRGKAAILEGHCYHVMLAFDTVAGMTPLPTLALYSGMEIWVELARDDPLVTRHFPLFNAQSPMNDFYVTVDRAAVSLAQSGTPFGALVLWLESAAYPEKLAAYRLATRGAA